MMAVTTAPPRVLTDEEYRTAWAPQGWRLLIIGPTSTWRQEWGEWEAIRDIVQNALDETEAYAWGYDRQGLWIADRGKGVQVADFLLGPPRPKPAHARGRFGEGMKIAALALLRKGYSVKVDTPDREIWMVFLKQMVDGHAETLAALWKAEGLYKYGTRFHLIGYTGPAFEDRFAVNIPRGYILHQGPSTLHEPVRRWNQLIGAPFQGRLYARDIYIRDINSPFSYNLWSFEMSPDRHAPRNEADLWTDVGRVWATVTSLPLLEWFLGTMKRPPDEPTDESAHVNLDYWGMGTEPVTGKRYADFIAEQAFAWREAWRRKVGDAVLRTDPRWDGTVKHLGYESVDVRWEVQRALAKAIKTDEKLVRESQERLREAKVIPDPQLTGKQLAHLRLARAIAQAVTARLLGVHAAIIPPASDRTRTAGLYSRATEEVFIASDQLEQARTTVDTVIHELAHHTSGAEDMTEAHNAEMTRVASRVVELTAVGRFDAELKGATW